LEQAMENVDFDIRESRCDDLANDLFTFVGREQRRLLWVRDNGNHDAIEQSSAAPDDVDVPECQRVERSGINDGGHVVNCSKPHSGDIIEPTAPRRGTPDVY